LAERKKKKKGPKFGLVHVDPGCDYHRYLDLGIAYTASTWAAVWILGEGNSRLPSNPSLQRTRFARR
jgi:hypothetical protein